MNKILILILILFITSCGSSRVQSNNNIYTGVDVSIEEQSSSKIKLDTDSSVGTYGPEAENSQDFKSNIAKNKSIGVVIAPANYRSILSLDLLKCFQINDQRVSLIAGAGFGALLASMYAQKYSSEEIRWKITNKSNQIKDIKNSSRPWSKEWLKFVNENIDENKIVISDISLWFPEIHGKQVRYKSAGAVKNELANNLNPEGKKYTLNYNVLSDDILNKLPVDRVVVLDAMLDKLVIAQPNELLIGIYGKIYSMNKNEINENSKIRHIKIKTPSALDDINVRIHLGELKELCSQLAKAID